MCASYDDLDRNNSTFEEYPLNVHDEWEWPIHETPSGAASLIDSSMFEQKITTKLVGIVLCGHHLTSTEHSCCYEKMANSLETDGWRCFVVARGDGQYARNLFYLEENSRETEKSYSDLLRSLGSKKVKMYKVKNRRNSIHWVSDASVHVVMHGLALGAMGNLCRAFHYIRENDVWNISIEC